MTTVVEFLKVCLLSLIKFDCYDIKIKEVLKYKLDTKRFEIFSVFL